MAERTIPQDLPKTKREAKSKGVPLYFTGKPCGRGHICERFSSNAWCVECSHDYSKDRYRIELSDPEKREKRNEYRRRYLTTEKSVATRRRYELARREAAAGRPRPEKCEACGRPGDIHFDHCHLTGKFRGWICESCNLALGKMNDDPDLLRRLASYVERHNHVLVQGDWVAEVMMQTMLGNLRSRKGNGR